MRRSRSTCFANDTDPDHDVLIVATVGQPANGVATVSSDGRTVEYTPQRLLWRGSFLRTG